MMIVVIYKKNRHNGFRCIHPSIVQEIKFELPMTTICARTKPIFVIVIND